MKRLICWLVGHKWDWRTQEIWGREHVTCVCPRCERIIQFEPAD